MESFRNGGAAALVRPLHVGVLSATRYSVPWLRGAYRGIGQLSPRDKSQGATTIGQPDNSPQLAANVGIRKMLLSNTRLSNTGTISHHELKIRGRSYSPFVEVLTGFLLNIAS